MRKFGLLRIKNLYNNGVTLARNRSELSLQNYKLKICSRVGWKAIGIEICQYCPTFLCPNVSFVKIESRNRKTFID